MAEQSESGARSANLEKDMAALKDDVARLRADIASLADALTQVASGYTQDAKKQASEKVSQAKARVDEHVDRAVNSGHEAMDNVERRIGERPIASLLTAATVGFILAKLLDMGGRR